MDAAIARLQRLADRVRVHRDLDGAVDVGEPAELVIDHPEIAVCEDVDAVGLPANFDRP